MKAKIVAIKETWTDEYLITDATFYPLDCSNEQLEQQLQKIKGVEKLALNRYKIVSPSTPLPVDSELTIRDNQIRVTHPTLNEKTQVYPQLSVKECRELGESCWWKNHDEKEVVLFQLTQRNLVIDSQFFRSMLANQVSRKVHRYEILEAKQLIKEISGKHPFEPKTMMRQVLKGNVRRPLA